MVITEQEYTKHYFIEGERVAAKIGSGFTNIPFKPFEEPPAGYQFDPNDKAEQLRQMVSRNIECVQYEGYWEINPSLEPAHFESEEYEPNQSHYHPDHLGSTSFITNAFGYNQRNNYSRRYTFSAKEKDNETGYSYFGARYYDSDLSVWLSVDPLANKYPSISPYMYCAGNQINYIDPNGRRIFVAIAIINAKGKPEVTLLQYKDGKLYNSDGSEYAGDNTFATDVVTALNYIVDNDADIGGVINVLSVTTKGDVTIVPGFEDNYNPDSNELSWSRKGMKVWNDSKGTKGRQSAATGLFHELVHGYFDIFASAMFRKKLDEYNEQYDSYEEKLIIEQYETRCAVKLGEGTRDNHSGSYRKFSSVISTFKKREVPKDDKNVPMF